MAAVVKPDMSSPPPHANASPLKTPTKAPATATAGGSGPTTPGKHPAHSTHAQHEPADPDSGAGPGAGAGAAGAPFPSLVRYDNPVLVSRVEHASSHGAHASTKRPPPGTPALGTHDAGGASSSGAAASSGDDAAAAGLHSPSKQGAGEGASAASASFPTDDILHSILPPREWEENGQLWQQKVSSTPATRLDVITLQEQLDTWLQRREARETGICPVRRELYSQCFDELIRQVSISCQERGLLLLRVRDEIRMSIAAYQTLYESSVAFGMRKALMAEWGKSDMETKIKELTAEKQALELSVAELKAKCESVEKRDAERRAMDERKHAEEIAFMKKTNLQLKTQLEGILAPQKK